MPARIVVIAGPDKGRRFDIESMVVTIGGHPGCEICLPDEPDSVATVRFRNGGYSVFNRGSDPLELADQTISSEGMQPWKPGHTLKLPSNVQLTLEVEGDPSPVRPQSSPLPGIEEDSLEKDLLSEVTAGENETAAKSKSGDIILYVGIAFLVMYMFVPDGSSEDARNDRRDFHAIVNVLLAPEMRASTLSPESSQAGEVEVPIELLELAEKATPEELAVFDNIREQIQYARVAELRHDRDGALKHYQESRDLLQRLSDRQNFSAAATLQTESRGQTSIYDVTFQFVVKEIESISR